MYSRVRAGKSSLRWHIVNDRIFSPSFFPLVFLMPAVRCASSQIRSAARVLLLRSASAVWCPDWYVEKITGRRPSGSLRFSSHLMIPRLSLSTLPTSSAASTEPRSSVGSSSLPIFVSSVAALSSSLSFLLLGSATCSSEQTDRVSSFSPSRSAQSSHARRSCRISPMLGAMTTVRAPPPPPPAIRLDTS